MNLVELDQPLRKLRLSGMADVPRNPPGAALLRWRPNQSLRRPRGRRHWIRQGVVRSGGGSGGRRYFCRQRPTGDLRAS